MTILTGKALSHQLRSICDAANRRLWVAVPYIGDAKAVRQVLGKRWSEDETFDVRLLIDTENRAYLNAESIERFRMKGTVKHLRGLHAKLYIADNQAILTSANLTRTAFACRFEAGALVDGANIPDIVAMFEAWWEKATSIDPAWFRTHHGRRRKKTDAETKYGSGLREQYELPDDPGDVSSKIDYDFRDFDHFLRQYAEFAKVYSSVQRLWTDAPLYFETDCFLNYLFHDAPRCPSAPYRKQLPQSLSSPERLRLLKHHAGEFAQHIRGDANARWRELASHVIQGLLKPEQLGTISWQDAKTVVDQLNCMTSLQLNKTRFLNPKNNDIEKIRMAWQILLHSSGDLLSRMTKCHHLLRFFGDSSIQELLGFYFPDRYTMLHNEQLPTTRGVLGQRSCQCGGKFRRRTYRDILVQKTG